MDSTRIAIFARQDAANQRQAYGRTTKTKEAATALPKPLDDITVLDMTVALAGPFATFLLAGLGARVIKVENPASGDHCRENAPYLGAEGASLVRRSADDVSVSAINRLRNKLGYYS